MTTDKTSVSRRGLFGVAGTTTLTAGLLAPFRALGGVAWAAETPKTYRKWIITKPVIDNKLTLEHFKMIEEPMPQIRQGQALAQIKMLNVHSGVRSRMGVKGSTKVGDTDNYNYTFAEILQSRDRTYKEGDQITSLGGWQTHQALSSDDGPQVGYVLPSDLVKELNGTNSPWSYVYRPVMLKMHQPDVLLDVFHTSGTTAYFGLRECGPLMPHDKVAVAGTTGSVGAMVAQLAKAKGSYVVGFGGGPDRAKWVTDTLGIDKALDYRAPDLEAQLRAAFPEGIDVYSDGVGGQLSETIVKLMNPNSRYLSYGTSAAFYEEVPGTTPMQRGRIFGMTDTVFQAIKEKNIKLEAWQVQAHYQDRIQSENDMSQLIYTGRLKPINTVVEGFENTAKGIMSQYETNVYGKLQLKYA
jgi:NADPH-dependent curcumin reductase CurA